MDRITVIIYRNAHLPSTKEVAHVAAINRQNSV
jgi:hypothetical protein